MDHRGLEALPASLRAGLLAEIDEGEVLRWCGQANPARAFLRALPLAFLAGLFFGGVAILFVIAARSVWLELHSLEPLIQWTRAGERPSYGSVWMCAGFAMFMGLMGMLAAATPWSARRTAGRMVFAVTSTRVLKLELLGADKARVESVEPGHPLYLSRKDAGGGVGDIVLGSHVRDRALMAMNCVQGVRELERTIRGTFDPQRP